MGLVWNKVGSPEAEAFIKQIAIQFGCQLYSDIKFNKETQVFKGPIRNGEYLGCIEVVLGSKGQPLSTLVTLSNS